MFVGRNKILKTSCGLISHKHVTALLKICTVVHAPFQSVVQDWVYYFDQVVCSSVLLCVFLCMCACNVFSYLSYGAWFSLHFEEDFMLLDTGHLHTVLCKMVFCLFKWGCVLDLILWCAQTASHAVSHARTNWMSNDFVLFIAFLFCITVLMISTVNKSVKCSLLQKSKCSCRLHSMNTLNYWNIHCGIDFKYGSSLFLSMRSATPLL